MSTPSVAIVPRSLPNKIEFGGTSTISIAATSSYIHRRRLQESQHGNGWVYFYGRDVDEHKLNLIMADEQAAIPPFPAQDDHNQTARGNHVDILPANQQVEILEQQNDHRQADNPALWLRFRNLQGPGDGDEDFLNLHILPVLHTFPVRHGADPALVAHPELADPNNLPDAIIVGDPNSCVGCLGDFGDEVLVLTACEHRWHKECLNRAFRVALESRSNWPVKCCNRRKGLDASTVHEDLENDVRKLLAERGQEFSTPNPIYCPQCSQFVPTAGVEGPWTVCCETAICVKCGEPPLKHLTPPVESVICPDKLSPEDRNLVKKQGWKICPTCRHLIERRDGCNLMLCSSCKTKFCYGCGETRDSTINCDCGLGLGDFAQFGQAGANGPQNRHLAQLAAGANGRTNLHQAQLSFIDLSFQARQQHPGPGPDAQRARAEAMVRQMRRVRRDGQIVDFEDPAVAVKRLLHLNRARNDQPAPRIAEPHN